MRLNALVRASAANLCRQAGLVDEMRISPVVLGRGEVMFAGLDRPALGFRVIDHVATDAATHIALAK